MSDSSSSRDRMVMTMLLRSKRALRVAARPLLAAGTLSAVVAWRLLRRLEVEGDSMRPTLLAGDRRLVVRGGRARAGDLVVVADPAPAQAQGEQPVPR